MKAVTIRKVVRAGAARTLVCTLAVLLTACSSAEDRRAEEARINAADHQHCVDLGFEEGTDGYGNCRLKLREIRAKQGRGGTDTHFGVGVGIGIGL